MNYLASEDVSAIYAFIKMIKDHDCYINSDFTIVMHKDIKRYEICGSEVHIYTYDGKKYINSVATIKNALKGDGGSADDDLHSSILNDEFDKLKNMIDDLHGQLNNLSS